MSVGNKDPIKLQTNHNVKFPITNPKSLYFSIFNQDVEGFYAEVD